MVLQNIATKFEGKTVHAHNEAYYFGKHNILVLYNYLYKYL